MSANRWIAKTKHCFRLLLPLADKLQKFCLSMEIQLNYGHVGKVSFFFLMERHLFFWSNCCFVTHYRAGYQENNLRGVVRRNIFALLKLKGKSVEIKMLY